MWCWKRTLSCFKTMTVMKVCKDYLLVWLYIWCSLSAGLIAAPTSGIGAYIMFLQRGFMDKYNLIVCLRKFYFNYIDNSFTLLLWVWLLCWVVILHCQTPLSQLDHCFLQYLLLLLSQGFWWQACLSPPSSKGFCKGLKDDCPWHLSFHWSGICHWSLRQCFSLGTSFKTACCLRWPSCPVSEPFLLANL